MRSVSKTFKADDQQWMKVILLDILLLVDKLYRADYLSHNDQQITCKQRHTCTCMNLFNGRVSGFQWYCLYLRALASISEQHTNNKTNSRFMVIMQVNLY